MQSKFTRKPLKTKKRGTRRVTHYFKRMAWMMSQRFRILRFKGA